MLNSQFNIPLTIAFTQEDGTKNVFIRNEEIGHGTFAVVYRVIHQNSNKTYAMKIISKEAYSKSKKSYEKLKNEIEIQKIVDHPNVVRSPFSFSDENYYYLVLEYCPGKSIREYLNNSEKGILKEPETRKILKDVIQGLIYLHSHQIIHYDLKIENFLVDSNGNVKIADFGISSFRKNEEGKKYSKSGTPNYLSPEVLRKEMRNDSYKVDIWAIGVSAFIMLTGKGPFEGETRELTFENILKGQFYFPLNFSISPEAKDFIKSILQIDPSKRPTAAELYNHQFLKRIDKETVNLYRPINLPQLIKSNQTSQKVQFQSPNIKSELPQIVSNQSATVKQNNLISPRQVILKSPRQNPPGTPRQSNANQPRHIILKSPRQNLPNSPKLANLNLSKQNNMNSPIHAILKSQRQNIFNPSKPTNVNSPRQANLNAARPGNLNSARQVRLNSAKPANLNSPKQANLNSPRPNPPNSPKLANLNSPRINIPNSPKQANLNPPRTQLPTSPNMANLNSPRQPPANSPKQANLSSPKQPNASKVTFAQCIDHRQASAANTEVVCIQNFLSRYCFYNEDLGYLLGDGIVGVCFKDGSSVVMDPNEHFVQVYKNQNSVVPEVHKLFDTKIDNDPKIEKLKKIAKNFKRIRFSYELSDEEYNPHVPLRNVKCFVKDEDSILFKFDDKNLQVNFNDHVKMVIFWNTKKMCFFKSMKEKCNLLDVKTVSSMNPGSDELKKFKNAKILMSNLSLTIC